MALYFRFEARALHLNYVTRYIGGRARGASHYPPTRHALYRPQPSVTTKSDAAKFSNFKMLFCECYIGISLP